MWNYFSRNDVYTGAIKRAVPPIVNLRNLLRLRPVLGTLLHFIGEQIKGLYNITYRYIFEFKNYCLGHSERNCIHIKKTGIDTNRRVNYVLR